jgi:hypothetical protein
MQFSGIIIIISSLHQIQHKIISLEKKFFKVQIYKVIQREVLFHQQN